jgi:probable F420-dependent oxidoreductase
MNLTKPGVFAMTDTLTASQLTSLVRKVEALGYSSFWFPEAFGRDPFTLAAHLLTVTDRLIVGTGIANVWKREPVTMISAARTLSEMFPERFILGVGISHGPLIAQLGIKYEKPVAFMSNYLARMKAAPYTAPAPSADPPILVAALMPKMLQLAATETSGTYPVYVTPEQTARMRAAIGPDKWLCVQQVATLESDAAKARAVGRGVLAFYLQLPNYVRTFRNHGFVDADFAGGGSDRLVDSLIAWGDEKSIRARVRAHYDAGATHVCLAMVPQDERVLQLLSPSK